MKKIIKITIAIFVLTLLFGVKQSLASCSSVSIPSGLSIINGSTTKTTVGLRWNASTVGGPGCSLAGYWIYANGNRYQFDSVNLSSVNSFLVTRLVPFTTFSFAVSGFTNDGSESARTSPVSTTTPPNVSVPVSVPSAPTSNYVLLSTTTGNYIYAATSSLGIPGMPSGSNGQVQFNSSGAFGGDLNFIWDNINKLLGINQSSPAAQIDIQSASPIEGNGVLVSFDPVTGELDGSGTDWLTSLRPGLILVDDPVGLTYVVTSVVNDSEIFVSPPVQGLDGPPDTYSYGPQTFRAQTALGKQSLVVTPGGNVGIGTNNPQTNLNIKEDSTVGIVLERANTCGTYDYANDGNARFIMSSDSFNDPFMEFQHGITGCTQSSFGMGIDFGWTDGTDFDARIIMSSAAALELQGAANYAFDGSGNVGIGLLSPDSKLDVNGTFKLEGTSAFTTASISGALVGLACDTSITTGLTGIASSTVFVTTPVAFPGNGIFFYTMGLTSTSARTYVCADVNATPNASTYNVRIIR